MPATPNDPFVAPVIKRADAEILSGIAPGEANYGNVDKTVRGLTKIPSLTETILPSIQKLLMPGEDNPYAKLIDQSTQGNVAAAQTDAMRRGLTGSDIEAASMVGARGQGEMAKSQFFAQNATQMAGFIKDLATGDISAQRENLIMMAQLMGQKITSDQDLAMFREMLQANIDQGDKNRKSALWGAGIGAAGSIIGGAMKFSDERLKEGVKLIGYAGDYPVYSFRWKKMAQAFLGAHDRVEVGFLAQDVQARRPDAVSEIQGFLAVDWGKLPSSVVKKALELGVANA